MLAGMAATVISYSQAPEAPVAQRVDVNQLREEGLAALRATRHLPVKKLHRLYVEQDPKVMPHIRLFQHAWDEDMRWYENSPAIRAKAVNPLSIIPLMEVKPLTEEEKVSLRPEFERLGVKAFQQVGDTCSLYSTQHLLQYAFAAAGMKAPSPNELMRLTGTDGVKVPTPILIQAATKASAPAGKVPHTMQFTGFSGNLSTKMFHEMVKHQIRNKRAVQVATADCTHAIVIVGFHTKDKKTTWEFLNSNRIWQDNGYSTIKGISDITAFSLWFEASVEK
jgi:hypothetical protein